MREGIEKLPDRGQQSRGGGVCSFWKSLSFDQNKAKQDSGEALVDIRHPVGKATPLPTEPTATKNLLREKPMYFHVAQRPANALP